MKKFVVAFVCLTALVAVSCRNEADVNTPAQDRKIWVEHLIKVAHPVLSNTAAGTLKQNMPYNGHADRDTRKFSYLEAFGRTVCGIAPWLESDADDLGLKQEYRDMTRKALANAVDPSSPDYMEFIDGRQPLVDAAYLAQGLLRAPVQLWEKSSDKTKADIIAALKETRDIIPGKSNWQLFASMVEAAIMEFTGECDVERMTKGVNHFKNEWYKGDGWYGDGQAFHMDYYNSYVIHPMMMDVLAVMKKYNVEGWEFIDVETMRHRRYAEILERMVAPDGTYPVLGRSISACRCGTFQVLSQAALLGNLPETVSAGQARSVLTAVIVRQFENPANFDENGWLRVGFAGYQPDMAETYVNTGSLYHCTTAFLALGLEEDDPFWTESYAPWTGIKAWSGEPIVGDHAIKN